MPGRRLSAQAIKAARLRQYRVNGQKGYHGVVVLSRLPFESSAIQIFCGKRDCRHVSIVLGERAGLKDPVTLHNFYVPAGGDIPDPAVNDKFAHKLAFLDEMHGSAALRPAPSERSIVVGDLNVAPLECDVWSHKQLLSVVSHTPIECEKLIRLQTAGGWIDAVRRFVPGAGEALHVVELSLARLGCGRQGPPARSYLGVAAARRPRIRRQDFKGFARLGAPLRPCPGNSNTGTVSDERVQTPMRPVSDERTPNELGDAQFAASIISTS